MSEVYYIPLTALGVTVIYIAGVLIMLNNNKLLQNTA